MHTKAMEDLNAKMSRKSFQMHKFKYFIHMCVASP